MSKTSVIFFQDEDGSVPALEWLREIKQRDVRITAKFHERIVELSVLGWELTRPAADTRQDGIRELRVRFGKNAPCRCRILILPPAVWRPSPPIQPHTLTYGLPRPPEEIQ